MSAKFVPKPAVEVAKPSAHFENAGEVLTDKALTKTEKTAVLDTLEQDARQLSEAAAEGMDGGEPNRLREVLEAQNKLLQQSPVNSGSVSPEHVEASPKRPGK
jgi:hypothetical protein